MTSTFPCHVAALVTLFGSFCRGTDPCPETCSCFPTLYGTTVECRGRDLEEYPKLLPADTVDLFLSFNSITSSLGDKLPALDRLENLEIESNQLTTLYADSFILQPNIKKLFANDNRITTVDPMAFRGLKNLRVVSLENNLLQNLPTGFLTVPLEVINLNGNNLHTIDPSAFPSSVAEIHLDSNSLSSVSRDMFINAKDSITSISVARNQVPLYIIPDTFEGFNLDTLDVKFSQISDSGFLTDVNCLSLDLSGNPLRVATFGDMSSLGTVEELKLSHMNISALTGHMLRRLTSVTRLDVSYNQLYLLDGNTFEHMQGLTELNAKANKIARFPQQLGAYAPAIKYLYLAENLISKLEMTDLSGLQLVELDLSFNRIQTLSQELAQQFDTIDKLDLTGNSFHCNCDLAWFGQWLISNNFRVGVSKCATPREVDFLDVEPEDLTCTQPKIIYKMPDEVIEAGSALVLKCTARGDPSPTITLVAPSGDNIRISPPRDKTDLTNRAAWEIENIDVEDAGGYLCIADNGHGTDRSTVHIDVSVDGRLPYDKTTRESTTTSQESSTPSITATHRSTTPQTALPTTHSITTTLVLKNITATTTNQDFKETPTVRSDYSQLSTIEISVIIIVTVAVAIIVVVVALVIIVVKRKRTMKHYDVVSGRRSSLLKYHDAKSAVPFDKHCEAHPML